MERDGSRRAHVQGLGPFPHRNRHLDVAALDGRLRQSCPLGAEADRGQSAQRVERLAAVSDQGSARLEDVPAQIAVSRVVRKRVPRLVDRLIDDREVVLQDLDRQGVESIPPRIRGSAKTAPMLALTAYGPNGSAQSGPRTTVPPTSACAVRITVPTLPGSEIPCR